MDSSDSENMFPSLSSHQDDVDQNPTGAYRNAISTVGRSAYRAAKEIPAVSII